MKSIKKIIIMGVVIATITITSATVFAGNSYNTKAEAVSGLTGKTVAEIMQECTETGKTYGLIAAEAGKLEEFKAANLQIKKERIKKQVESGTLTEEKGKEIINNIEKNQEACDGTGKLGRGNGLSEGNGIICDGTGTGRGNGTGAKNGDGYGRYQRAKNGECTSR